MIKSLLMRFTHRHVTLPRVTATFDRVFGPKGRIARFNTSKKWHSHSHRHRVSFLALAALFSFSLLAESLAFYRPASASARITPEIQSLLTDPIQQYADLLDYDATNRQFVFNQGFTPTNNGLGFSSSAQFTGVFPLDGSDGIDITDPSSQATIKITPRFEVGLGERDSNRIVYPLEGRDGMKVISLAGIGYKEDIILNSFQGDSLSFSYDLELPAGVEARLEQDGSIGFYGVQSELLGNVTTGTEKDAQLLKDAQANGVKNNLLFKMPPPYVIEYGKKDTGVDTYFELNDDILTTKTTNLRGATYPLTIDPSVYVETARKFMRGNNESNVDFDTDNELIQKGSTTGARFDNWASTLALNEGRYDGASTIAGGYSYYVGGVGSAGGGTTTTYSTAGSNTYSVPSGVAQVLVKIWGAGGGGGGGGTASEGGTGGGGAYTTAIVPVTALENLNIIVGGGGARGDFSSGGSGTISGDGGGGGGHSEVNRSGTPLIIAAAGGGGGGGDNSSATAGGQGAPGGDETSGNDGGNSSGAAGGAGATTGAGGAGGTGGSNSGSSGGSEFGGAGADGRSNNGSDGSKNNGGSNGGGDGGNGDQNANGYGAGGGGGSGFYGGGGGSGSVPGNAGGGGGGSGVSYFEGLATGTNAQTGSGSTPGNSADGDRSGAGDGGSGGTTNSSGTNGAAGLVQITPYFGVETKTEVYWSNVNGNSGVLESPNPGSGACSNWCTESEYDLPEGRRGFSLVAYNGFLYAIGGEDSAGNRESTIFIAKIGANGEPSLWHPTDSNQDNWVYWYADTELSEGVAYSGAVAYNNRMYLLGGQTDAATGGTTTVQYTDIQPTGTLGTWTSVGVLGLSTARFQHTVEVYNDYLYVVGGDSSSSGSLLNTVEYVRLADDGTFSGSWETTASFSGARRTDGNSFTTIYGAYLYITGGCTSVSSGNCQTVGDEIQIASIFADGSLGEWSTDSNETNQLVGYGLHSWQGSIYRIGGCATLDAFGECTAGSSSVDYGVINPPGEVSTVNITEASGSGNCTGGSPQDCDLPDLGDGAGEGGGMLSATTILNGYMYIIGGCTNFGCSTSSGNVSYASVSSDGSLSRPADCAANGNTLADNGGGAGAWCVDNTRRVNGTSGISAAGVTTFNNRIYLIGGIDETGSGTQSIYYNSPEDDGSFSGAWTADTFNTVGMTTGGDETGEKAYTYAYARANPASAATNPGNLYIFGGCSAISASAGCAGSYNSSVYKCNIRTNGDVRGCTTTGQLQIDVELEDDSNEGLGLHSGTVYANYIYLIGGFSDAIGDRDTTFYARFDDSNNIVDVDSGAVAGAADDWIESPNDLSVGRRRGWTFGYNGHIYAVGGFDADVIGTIPFIEWSKLNVSTGENNGYVTSQVTINQRWGLSMAVSNSFAYVIGGCDVGDSPGGCSSFEPSIQTFQLYNNDSGAQANFTESVGNFDTLNDRIGSSSAILDGYIYVAGGVNSSTVTSDVQYAVLNPNGTIGSWSSTTADLPAGRAYGQLEAAGGSLYYIGGEDTAGDEKSEVYYATPTGGTASSDVVRTTTYKINGTQFSGLNYTLPLNNSLSSNYFAIVAGGDDTSNTSGPDSSQVRVDGDPFGALSATTSADEIRIERGIADDNWDGTVTIVECMSECTTNGFELSEVINGESGADGNLPSADLSVDYTLGSAHSANTVPFGGGFGGGLMTAESDQNNFSATAGVRVRKNSTNQIRVERDDTQGTAAAADITIYVVEWGSNWNVEEADFDNWNAGDSGVDDAGEYSTQTITSVTRDNTWLWKSPGTSEQNGLGDGAFGKVLTLGDGTNTQGATETTVALGSRVSAGADIRNDTVYVMEHVDLAVDYSKYAQANETSFTQTVDAAIEAQSVTTDASGNTVSAGYAFPLLYASSNGTGTAYSRSGGWSFYHSNDTTVSVARGYGGQDAAAWVQSVDFGASAGSGGAVDIATWSTASNGLPGDRTRHGAAVWNDRLYVVGGLDDSNSETNTVYISPQLSSGGNITSAWTSDADVPDVVRSGATVITYANNLYFLGGNDGTNYLSDVQFAQINSDGTVDPWTFTTSLPQYVSDADGFAVNGFMYLFGGRSATSTCTNNSYVSPISANTTIASGNNPTGIGEWYQTNIEFTGDRYSSAVAYDQGKVYVSGGGCGTELTSDQHYVGTLRAQPQIARYSYYVDADTDVAPNAWLLNGIDNDIGARWQFGYRSAVDAKPLEGVKTIELTNFQDNSQNFRELDVFDENNSELSYTASDGGSMTYLGGTSLSRINDDNISTAGADDYQVHPTDAIGKTITMTFVSPEEIGGALFYNRTGCCNERIGGATLVFKDSSGDVLHTYTFPVGANPAEVEINTFGLSGEGWGQNTDFGDVTLGNVEDYTPLNSAGVDTEFARYFYVTVSIDASQTFGYPDDVSRGPTVDDMTIFFVSDPNKRLRHGKTFIQGQEQPLDTPPPGY